MALLNRYWVGGSGSVYDTSHWSATSGGAGGASQPDANDYVIFDANSGTGICVGGGTHQWRSLHTIGSNIQINSDLNIGPDGVSMGRSFEVGYNITISQGNLYSNGYYFGSNLFITSSVVNFGDNFTGANISINGGTLNTNSHQVNATAISISPGATLNLGSSNIIIGSWYNNGNVSQTGSSITVSSYFAGTPSGGGIVYNNVIVSGGVVTVDNSNTFTNLTIAPGTDLRIMSGTNQTVSNLICDGTASPIILQTTSSTPATLTNNGSPYIVKSTSIYSITAAGTGKLSADQSCVDLGNNTNWDFLVGTSKLFLFFGEFA